MPPSLDTRLADVRRRVRQALLTYGVSWAATVVIGAVLVACVGDWLFHFDDPGVRLILGLAILGGGGWVIHRFLVRPLLVRFNDTDIALRIEDRYPGFRDSLASTVQFAASREDPRVGSPVLQRVVIEQTLSRLEGMDFSDVVQTRDVRRVAVVALSVCLATMSIALLYQTQTAIALQRLLFPFSAPAWPRQTNLRLLNAEMQPLQHDEQDPLQIARGDTLKLFAENTSGRLPSRVTLQYRTANDEKIVSEAMRPTTLNDADGQPRELAVGQLPTLKGEMFFRAVGGDDESMAWHRLQVIPPPAVESLRVTLTPPSYTKRPVEKLPEGAGHLQGLIGTQVEISATVNKPLKSAMLRVKDQERHPVKIGADGKRVQTTFIIREAGIYSWWLDLKDSQGFENAEPPRYEVRGIQDFEPEIAIDVPQTDMQVTGDAEVIVKTTAKDDLGIKEMRLVFRHQFPEGGEGTHRIPLFDGINRPAQNTTEYVWKLSEVDPLLKRDKMIPPDSSKDVSNLSPRELSLGARIIFHTEATDDYAPPSGAKGAAAQPHVGRSISRTLTIVSREQKTQELAQRQAGLLDDLERAAKQQRQARDQVRDLEVQLNNAGTLRTEDVDALQRTELGQRDVARQLTGSENGLEKRIRDLLAEMRGNHLDDPASERRLEGMAEELARLGDENFPVIEEELTQARKLSQAQRMGDTRNAERGARNKQGGSGNRKPGAKSESRERETKNGEPQSSTNDGKDESTPKKNDREAASKSTSKDREANRQKSQDSDQVPNNTKAASGDESRGEKPDWGETPDPSGEKAQGKPAGDQPQKNAKTARKNNKAAGRPSKGKSSRRPEEALRQVAENQDSVLESLSEMLQDLSQWRNETDASRELADIAKQQEDLNKQAGELGRQTLTKPREALSPQEQADLAKLAERQKRQAEQFEQLEAKMREMAEELARENPAAARTLKDALDQAAQEAVAGRMRETAGQLNENRMGEASRSQEEILQKLHDLQDTLQNKRDSDTETLVKKMKQAEQELQGLRDKQAELLKKMEQAAQNPDTSQGEEELKKLRREQEQLRDETAKMSRKLQRLQARKPGSSAQRAAERMQQAEENMDDGDQAEAMQDQQEALDDLEQAQRELARDRRRAEEQLAQEQLEKIADELKDMIGREQAVIDETRRLDGLHSEAGKWSRAQILSLRDLGTVQHTLKDETDRLVEKLTAAEVFALALKGASRNMQRAADLLGEKNAGIETQQAEEAARQRFVDLIEALKQDQDEMSQRNQQEQEGGGEQGDQEQGPPTDGIPTLAQIKMLITLQRELMQRTKDLSEIREKTGRLTPAQQQELETLAREQEELADLTTNLSQKALSGGAEDSGAAQPEPKKTEKPADRDPDAPRPE